MEELEAPDGNLPPQFVLREMVIERVVRTRQLHVSKLDPFRDELWALYADAKVRIDFRPFRVMLTAFGPGDGTRPVIEVRLLPDRPVAATRWTLTGRVTEDLWLVVDAVLDQLESLAETMGFHHRVPTTGSWIADEQEGPADEPFGTDVTDSQLKAG